MHASFTGQRSTMAARLNIGSKQVSWCLTPSQPGKKWEEKEKFLAVSEAFVAIF